MKLDDLKELMSGTVYPPTENEVPTIRERILHLGLDPDNLYQELEMTSRYADTHRDTGYSNELLHLHSHTFYEIVCCRNTCGAEYLVGTKRYRLQKGDIILVPPGISHRPLLPEAMSQPYRRDILWISRELADRLRRIYPERPEFSPLRGALLRTAGTKWDYIPELIHNGVLEAEERSPGWEAMVLGNTISLAVHLKRAFLDSDTAPAKAESADLLDRAMSYIEHNLGKKITLEDSAARLYVSESTLSQTFRKKMGVSFYRCVTQRRLIAAKTLIAEGILLEDVATQVGFSDYSGFYRAFRQEYGISPRQFRKLEDADESKT